MGRDIIEIANAVCSLYPKFFDDSDLTEMKIHKLLYFSQKKHYETFGEWLFDDDFQGWVHGPVNRKVRNWFNSPKTIECPQLTLEEEYTIRETLFEYGVYSAEVLSNLSHEEYAYKKSRVGLTPRERGTNIIKKQDIIHDISVAQNDLSNECEVH